MTTPNSNSNNDGDQHGRKDPPIGGFKVKIKGSTGKVYWGADGDGYIELVKEKDALVFEDYREEQWKVSGSELWLSFAREPLVLVQQASGTKVNHDTSTHRVTVQQGTGTIRAAINTSTGKVSTIDPNESGTPPPNEYEKA